MERRLNLIKSDFEKHEKRVLPRFPFCYLTFKSDDTSRVYEVKDISHTGMQLSLKEDGHAFAADSVLKGSIHWLGKNLGIAGTVKWSTSHRLGVEFAKRREVTDKVQDFLNTLHSSFQVNLHRLNPDQNLKYNQLTLDCNNLSIRYNILIYTCQSLLIVWFLNLSLTSFNIIGSYI